jgi:hypothetical protein
MVIVPELCGDEEIVAPDHSFSQHVFQLFAHRLFVSISLRAIELAKADFQSSSSRAPGIAKIGDQGSKPKGGNGSPVIHLNFSRTKFVLVTHRSPRYPLELLRRTYHSRRAEPGQSDDGIGEPFA